MRTILFSIFAITILFTACTRSPYGDDGEEPELWNTILITEVVSNNISVLADEFGDFDDYIELYNPQDSAVDLGGWGLSDVLGSVKFVFPAPCPILPDSVLLVWCDGEAEEGDFHADFRINALGEWVGLYDGEMSIIDSISVPALSGDQALLREATGWIIGTPSPGVHTP